jgi:16S rRNA (guanine966-N2)-methyltransferase
LALLSAGNAPWDIVFVDPPFDGSLGESALKTLARHRCLRQTSWVYFETRRSQPECVPEEDYCIFRKKTAGDVQYQLLQLRPD